MKCRQPINDHSNTVSQACCSMSKSKDWNCSQQGGFIRKLPEWKQPGKAFLLSVEDAQQPGKDIGSGTFNIRLIQRLLAACSSTLQQCLAQHRSPAQREADAWTAVQVSQGIRSCSTCLHESIAQP